MPETFVAEMIALLAGAGIVAAIWRHERRVLRCAAGACVLLLLVVIAQAISGWPQYRARLDDPSRVTAETTQFARAHHVLGHIAVPLIAFLLPTLLAAALRRRAVIRRALHVAAVVLLALLGFASSITGYLLPAQMPGGSRELVAATILRFALLHVFGATPGLATLLMLLAYRHWRRGRAVSVHS